LPVLTGARRQNKDDHESKHRASSRFNIESRDNRRHSGDIHFLRARLNVSLPGLEREVAQANATHGETCAYSNAARGNIEVTQATTDLVADFLLSRS
jgi:organic hydroperoxide reductase OsmC/OhrA